MKTNAREIALKILNEINEEGAYSNISISRNLSHSISDLDQGFIRELVYGVLENMILIDYHIEQFSKVKLKKISPVIMNILRLGVYQIMFMDKIPDRASVNESVNLAKKYSHRGATGYVNGLLRGLLRNKDNIKYPNAKSDPIRYLSIRYSHPDWMVKAWVKEFGFNFTEQLCIANNERPKLNIRTNTLKISRNDLIDRLLKYDYRCLESKYAKEGMIVENPVRITDTVEFKEGLFQIQDESSMLVAQVMAPKENSLVVDVCSAPGGKSTHIAQYMNNKGKIVSRDIYSHKINLIKENANRLGIDIIMVEEHNALEIDNNLIGKADYCLVDAPCSGLGLIRRKPEIKWNKNEDNIKEITDLQLQILENASKYLRKKGILVYSTCTIAKEENINLINRFLDRNKEFQLIPIKEIENINEPTLENGYLELYPNLHGTDGFFIAKLIKL